MASSQLPPSGLQQPEDRRSLKCNIARAMVVFQDQLTQQNTDSDGAGSLCQVWLPEVAPDGNGVVLATKDLPFCVAGVGDLLALFRCITCRYTFGTDPRRPEKMGAPGRVFLSNEPEASRNVQKYSKEVYLRCAGAQQCKVHSTLLVPLFSGSAGGRTVGVLEVVQSSEDMRFGAMIRALSEVLQRFGLFTFDGYTARVPIHVSAVSMAPPALDMGTEFYRLGPPATGGATDATDSAVPWQHHEATPTTASGAADSGGIGDGLLQYPEDEEGQVTFSQLPNLPLLPVLRSCETLALECSHNSTTSLEKLSLAENAAEAGDEFELVPPHQLHQRQQMGRTQSGAAIARDAAGGPPVAGAGTALGLPAEARAAVPTPGAGCTADAGLATASPRLGAAAQVAELSTTAAAAAREDKICRFGELGTRGSSGSGRASGMGGMGFVTADADSDEDDSGEVGSDGDGLDTGEAPDSLMGELHRRKGRGSGNPGKPGKRLGLEDLQQQFGVGLKEAASQLGVCPTTLKRACRRHGIQRWPRRQLIKISKAIDQIQANTTSPTPLNAAAQAIGQQGASSCAPPDDRWTCLAQLIPGIGRGKSATARIKDSGAARIGFPTSARSASFSLAKHEQQPLQQEEGGAPQQEPQPALQQTRLAHLVARGFSAAAGSKGTANAAAATPALLVPAPQQHLPLQQVSWGMQLNGVAPAFPALGQQQQAQQQGVLPGYLTSVGLPMPAVPVQSYGGNVPGLAAGAPPTEPPIAAADPGMGMLLHFQRWPSTHTPVSPSSAGAAAAPSAAYGMSAPAWPPMPQPSATAGTARVAGAMQQPQIPGTAAVASNGGMNGGGSILLQHTPNTSTGIVPAPAGGGGGGGNGGASPAASGPALPPAPVRRGPGSSSDLASLFPELPPYAAGGGELGADDLAALVDPEVMRLILGDAPTHTT